MILLKIINHFITTHNLILLCLIHPALTMDHQRIYNVVRHCATNHHVPYATVTTETIELFTPDSCVMRCADTFQCGSVVFEEDMQECHLLDKDFLVCNEEIGVIQVVCINCL